MLAGPDDEAGCMPDMGCKRDHRYTAAPLGTHVRRHYRVCRRIGGCQSRQGRIASVASAVLPVPAGIAMPTPGGLTARPSRPTTRNAVITASVPKITDPAAWR